MLKAQALFDPNSCLNKAAADEPVFILRAKDPLAAQTVRLWSEMALNTHEEGKRKQAMEWAMQAEAWLEAKTEKELAEKEKCVAEKLARERAEENERLKRMEATKAEAPTPNHRMCRTAMPVAVPTEELRGGLIQPAPEKLQNAAPATLLSEVANAYSWDIECRDKTILQPVIRHAIHSFEAVFFSTLNGIKLGELIRLPGRYKLTCWRLNDVMHKSWELSNLNAIAAEFREYHRNQI